MNDTVTDTSEAAARAPKALTTMDEVTERGLLELLEKLAPLLQGRRLHNLVDLASLASDGVDMFDEAMVQKLMKAYEESVGAAWNVGNAARFAATQTAQTQVPSLFGLLRVAGDEDVRRGLYFALTFLSVLGRQMKDDGIA